MFTKLKNQISFLEMLQKYLELRKEDEFGGWAENLFEEVKFWLNL